MLFYSISTKLQTLWRHWASVETILKSIIFAAYDKNDGKLKSSAWYFWQYQFSDSVEPEWSGIDILYPSDQGWSGWTLHECGLPKDKNTH